METFWIKKQVSKKKSQKSQLRQQQDNPNLKENKTKKIFQNLLKPKEQFRHINKRPKTNLFLSNQK